MKETHKLIKAINNLLLMNYEAERIYIETLDIVKDTRLKTFFRERGYERNEYGRQLRAEITNLGGIPRSHDGLSRDYYKLWINFKRLLLEDEESEALLDEVCYVKQLSIDAYDEVLHMHKLPISLCKILVEQRDNIQAGIYAIRAKEQLVA